MCIRDRVIIVPCGITVNLKEADRTKLLDACKEFENSLKEAKLRAQGDYRDNYTPGWKFNHWELKVCILYVLKKCQNCSLYGGISFVM